MKKEASRARAPMVQPIDPFLPETGRPRQIDPAYRLQPAQAANERSIRRRAIEEKRRADSFAQFAIGDASADGVLERALQSFVGSSGPRFNRSAQTHAKNFLQEQAAD